MNTSTIRSRDNLLTDCERSMRYHQARTSFYNSAHLFIQFLVFALASVGVYHLIVSLLSEDALIWLFAAVGLLALLSLVYNPADKAALHRSLYRGFTMLAGAIAATPEADEATLAQWTGSIHALYAEEPPVYRALHAHCGNQIVIALGAGREHLADLRWYHRLLRNLISFQGSEFPSRNQARQAAETS